MADSSTLFDLPGTTYVQGLEQAAAHLTSYIHERGDQFWHAWNIIAIERDRLRCPDCNTHGQTGVLDEKGHPVMCEHLGIEKWAVDRG